MLQGTGSDVGKSLLCAGLCRALTNRCLRVRPFKPQNMSNNAAVTSDGGEIGRAQALQALACRIEPATDMNPVLLKPQSGAGAQLVVQGRVRGNQEARAYQAMKGTLLPMVLESFHRLREHADIIIVEGAGSPAEINLRQGDIANMGFALAADVPVALVADIDRGGAIAQLVGTWELLEGPERALARGFIINKFRGDVSLFDDGLAEIIARTGMESYGVVPFFDDAHRLPPEDSFGVRNAPAQDGSAAIKIAVPIFPRIANFDDFDPLKAEPGISVEMIPPGRALPGDADLIVLPGSKATLADLAVLRAEGWDIDIRAHLRRGGKILGICGGYQMLGRRIDDLDGIEGPPGSAEGLGLLDMETRLAGGKRLARITGAHQASGAAISGYEMHVGHTEGPDCARPFLRLENGPDGATSGDGLVMGCYVHGLFVADGFRRVFLDTLGACEGGSIDYQAGIERTLDALARHLEDSLDIDRLLQLAGYKAKPAMTATGPPIW
ncbi:MAG: cobyric acid synthase [Alphaproteobacteria bacterium]